MTGCLVQLSSRSEFEQGLIIELRCQSSYLAFRALGSIQQIRGRGMLIGIGFLDTSARMELDLHDLIAHLEGDRVGRTAVARQRPLREEQTLWQKWFTPES